jgi:hypothetical protein
MKLGSHGGFGESTLFIGGDEGVVGGVETPMVL